MHELMYPNHVVTMKAVSPGYQPKSNLMQMAFRILQVKKGTQQTRNTAEIEKRVGECYSTIFLVQFFQLVNFFLDQSQDDILYVGYISEVVSNM